jgi:rhamnosyltransferase
MLGGFPEDVIMFEDMLFAANLILKGFSIEYVPGAKVIHSHDFSFSGQFIRYFQAGVSFKKNSWFLEYAKSGSEGVRFLKEEVRFFIQKNAYYWVLYAIIEAMFKYSGYKIGLNYDKLPHLSKKKRNE